MRAPLLLLKVSLALTLSALVLGCGRTTLDDDTVPDAGQFKPDSGLADAGSARVDAGTDEEPVAVYIARPGCPRDGGVSDMRATSSSQRFTAVSAQLLEECSGAGGHWFVGRGLDAAAEDFMLGDHACYFLGLFPLATTPNPPKFGVVLSEVHMAGLTGPSGWCIRDESGREPVRSFERVLGLALFRTREGAERARSRWAAAR